MSKSLTADQAESITPSKLTFFVLVVSFLAGLIAALFSYGFIKPHTGLGTAIVFSGIVTALAVTLPMYFIALPRLGGMMRAERRGLPERDVTTIDPLTRTLNRRGIVIGLFDLMALADRYNHELSVALVNIDRLAGINEEHGRDVGDQVLASIAGVLAEALRMPDHVGRYTESNFLLILPETELDAAQKLAERVRTGTANAPIDVNGKPVATTISIGVAEFHKGEDVDQLISRAEAALQNAKAAGGNSVVTQAA